MEFERRLEAGRDEACCLAVVLVDLGQASEERAEGAIGIRRGGGAGAELDGDSPILFAC